MDAQVRDATEADAWYIAMNLRHDDAEELRQAQPLSPGDAVRIGYRMSAWAKVACVEQRPAVLYGVAPLGDWGGSPWMLATDDINRISRDVVRVSRRDVVRMEREFGFLFNQVHVANAVAIKWLRWLGFQVASTPTGPGGAFYNFWKGEIPCVTQ